MRNQRLVAKLQGLKDLPSLPHVVSQLFEKLEDERSSAADLTAIIENDHALSARMLKLANSAFYGATHRIDSIRRAVVVLGFEAVRNLVVSTSVMSTLHNQSQFALDPDDFWLHSLGTAKTAQRLSRRAAGTATPESCFTVGLLHDIGKYVLALVLEEEYTALVRHAQQRMIPLRVHEHEILGTTHARVGAWMAERWSLPPIFQHVIGNQYRLQQYSGVYQVETACISLSDNIVRKAGLGCAGDPDTGSFDPYPLELLGITIDDVHAIIDEMAEIREEAERFLNVMMQAA